MSSSCVTKLELTTPAPYKFQDCVAATAVAEHYDNCTLLTGLMMVQPLRICMSQQASPSGRYMFAEAAADSVQQDKTPVCCICTSYSGLHRAFLCGLYRVAR